jgi:hypothetical protein
MAVRVAQETGDDPVSGHVHIAVGPEIFRSRGYGFNGVRCHKRERALIAVMKGTLMAVLVTLPDDCSQLHSCCSFPDLVLWRVAGGG